jgi:hypothetical protein
VTVDAMLTMITVCFSNEEARRVDGGVRDVGYDELVECK